MSYAEFLRFIFPAGLFDYFELSDFKEKPDQVEISFEEKNIRPQEYATDKNWRVRDFTNLSGCMIIRCEVAPVCCLSRNAGGSITVGVNM